MMETYETSKNSALLETDRVVKTFKRAPRAVTRFRHELTSLRRLSGVIGIPKLLEVSEPELRLVLSRLPGQPLTTAQAVPDSAFLDLRDLVARMLACGVARHSMPPRDVIVGPGGEVGLVDFERVTLRGWRHNPIWLISCWITRYHMLRLIGDRAPHLLSEEEKRTLAIQRRLGGLYHSFILLRRRIRGR